VLRGERLSVGVGSPDKLRWQAQTYLLGVLELPSDHHGRQHSHGHVVVSIVERAPYARARCFSIGQLG
jgi:hypothetical protein